MGLDTVEIILRTEEVFAIDLPDEDCGQVVTVGGLYRLVLDKLNLPDSRAGGMEANCSTAPPGRNRLRDQYPGLAPWTARDAWVTLTAIIENQLQVDPEEITDDATFSDDLRCD